MTHDAARAAVLEEALTWRGTPFHDNAEIKGVGADCAHFVHAVYFNAGIIGDQHVEKYSPQWMLHRDEERFLSYVLKVSSEVPLDALQPADLVVYKFGRCYAHGAIVIDWPRSVIHAWKQANCVLISGPCEGNLIGRRMRGFSFWGKT